MPRRCENLSNEALVKCLLFAKFCAGYQASVQKNVACHGYRKCHGEERHGDNEQVVGDGFAYLTVQQRHGGAGESAGGAPDAGEGVERAAHYAPCGVGEEICRRHIYQAKQIDGTPSYYGAPME